MTGFSDPIIGGGGALVYPAIKSPDFSLTAKTGWSIDKNGSAYFFNVSAAGEVTVGAAGGPQVIIEPGANIAVAASIGGLAPSDVTSFSDLQQVIKLPSGAAAETDPAIIGVTIVTYTNGETAMGLLSCGAFTGSAGAANGQFTMQLSVSSGGTYRGGVISGSYTYGLAGILTLLPSSVVRDNGDINIYSPGQLVTLNNAAGSLLVPAEETWHALGGVAGMTGPTDYRMTSENEVQIEIRLVSTAGTAAGTYSFANLLPAAYTPLSNVILDAVSTDLTSSGTTRPRVFVSSSTGQVQAIFNALTTGQMFHCHARYPLNV